jgi:hypothetical protein
MKHLNEFRVGVAPAGVDKNMKWGVAERKAFSAAAERIAPHLLPAGRMERARAAWRKYIGGHLNLRAMILVSRDYAVEFAEFRRQGAAAKQQTD